MTALDFTSSRRKLERAEDHLEALGDKLIATLQPPKNPLSIDSDDQVQGRTADGGVLRLHRFWITRAPAFDEGHGILLGDTLQNFRAVLDHAVWTITHQGRGLSAVRKRKVAFPLTQSAKSLRAQWRNYVPDVPWGATSPYWAIIERHQPYKRTELGETMRTLRNLSDSDKHRVIIPMNVAPTNIEMSIKLEGDARIVAPAHWHIAGKRIKPKAKLVDVLVHHGPSGKFDMYVDGEVGGYPELPGRLPLERWLNRIRDTCRGIIAEFEGVR